MSTDYTAMCAMARSLVRDVPHLVTRLANLAALVWDSLDDINWAGFYTVENQKSLRGGHYKSPYYCPTW